MQIHSRLVLGNFVEQIIPTAFDSVTIALYMMFISQALLSK